MEFDEIFSDCYFSFLLKVNDPFCDKVKSRNQGLNFLLYLIMQLLHVRYLKEDEKN